MPFTFAHPAAVLWCARWRGSGLPFAAFVIGSMSPDFEYFLRLRMLSFYSHTAPGIFTFCIPVGLLVYGIYQTSIAPALYRNLPHYARARVSDPPQVGGDRLRHLVLVSVAIAFGAATHVLWDGFTHGGGPFVLRWPGLGTEMMGFPLYKFLQHGSTLVGFGIMALWFHLRPVQPARCGEARDRWYWPAAAAAFGVAFISLQQIRPGLGLANLAIQSIDGLFIALLVARCCSRLKTRIARN